MILSVAIIAKNEEDIITRCLESVKDADEIIICDTGSTDKTVEIAHNFSDKVTVYTDFVWCDDFSKARNHCLSKCIGEWILTIDCDEVLRTDVNVIKKIISLGEAPVVDVKVFSGEATHYQPRLFANNPDHYYIGSCHECLSVVGQKRIDVEIEYFYSETHAKDPDRNLRILAASLRENPNQIRERFYIAREIYYKKDYEAAVLWLDEYLEVGTWLAERAEAYYLKAICLWQLNRGDEARAACVQALVINANMRKAHALMAEMSWTKNAEAWKKFAELADNSDVIFST